MPAAALLGGSGTDDAAKPRQRPGEFLQGRIVAPNALGAGARDAMLDEGRALQPFHFSHNAREVQGPAAIVNSALIGVITLDQ